MKQLLLLLPLIALLTACQSKREICARWSVAEDWCYRCEEKTRARLDAAGKLGLELDPRSGTPDVRASLAAGKLYSFCKYYEN